MTGPQSGFIPTYNSLTDKHLAGYFSNTRIRRHLQRSGLISRSGRIISEKEYQRNEVRKNHLRHLEETLTRTIFCKILDLKRRQQLELMKKLENSVRMEKLQKIKMERSRKIVGGGTPAYMPHPPHCPRNRHDLHLSVSGEPAAQCHLGERIGVRPVNAKGLGTDRCLPHFPLGGDYVMPMPHPPGPKEHRSAAAVRHGMPRWRQARPITAPDGQLSAKMEHSRKIVGGGTPAYMPHPPHCPRNRPGLQLSVTGEPAAQSHLGERIGVRPVNAKGLGTDRCLPHFPLGGDYVMPVPHPPGPKEHRSAAAVRHGMPRWRQARPITAPDGQLSAKSSGAFHRPSLHSNVLVTMVFLGKNLHLAHPDTHYRDEIKVYQQHCGGENLCVYTGMLLEKETFQFTSRRHHGFPFSLTFYLNGMQVDRLSCCCEFRLQKRSRLGGRRGYFGFLHVEGASPCYRCAVDLSLDQKPSPPKKKAEQNHKGKPLEDGVQSEPSQGSAEQKSSRAAVLVILPSPEESEDKTETGEEFREEERGKVSEDESTDRQEGSEKNAKAPGRASVGQPEQTLVSCSAAESLQSIVTEVESSSEECAGSEEEEVDEEASEAEEEINTGGESGDHMNGMSRPSSGDGCEDQREASAQKAAQGSERGSVEASAGCPGSDSEDDKQGWFLHQEAERSQPDASFLLCAWPCP
ncbi:glutamate-rich protein 3 [Dryobates pubescens]|uniref:glutamate-rich protein 3 n=1 Tax=Dryobates pubescens TaxID=118200 RepID=UPI0023B8F308|nr:glutamate-rich protein 3 [Dryobates pubescens]